MSSMQQFRSRDASLWQSAVDQVVSQETVAVSPAAGLHPSHRRVMRPPRTNDIEQADSIAGAIDKNLTVPAVPPPSAAAGIADTAKYCAVETYRLAEAKVKAILTGNDAELKRAEEAISQFTTCDPRWTQVLQVYVQSKVDASTCTIPYLRHVSLDDFVIDDGRLPDPATVAIIGDWGTGQDGARKLLQRVASKKPDVVIHLGDVYYSGTAHEVQHYFYAIWQEVLGLPKVAWGGTPADTSARPATFHLSGNHDMYAGGGPYYTVIKMLGQPASYFCLRNRHWQFIALDTGLHDSNPLKEGTETYLEDTEVAWLKHQVQAAGGRKTVLLSHHQLFTHFDAIAGKAVNDRLLAQVRDVLPNVTAWLWGHEHNLVVYGRHLGVLGRCVGHGAFPVGVDEPQGHPFTDVPVESVTLAKDAAGGLFQHGYMLLTLSGTSANASYFQYDSDRDREDALYTEEF
jgi:hypothetical protein